MARVFSWCRSFPVALKTATLTAQASKPVRDIEATVSLAKDVTLVAEPATWDNVKEFGVLLGDDPAVAALPIDFYDGTVAVKQIARFVSDDTTDLPLVLAEPRPMVIRCMERHFKHTQTFIPLDGKPFVVVVAPPSASELPDMNRARALKFDGSCGFLLHLGTWHEFPFPLEEKTSMVVILRPEATDGLMSSGPLPHEAASPDIDKKNMVARTGLTYRVAI